MINLDIFVKDSESIRSQNPLVLNITNFVSMNFTANTLLAIGASPLMSSSIDEIPELVSACSSMVINIGCVDSVQAECMHAAATEA